ncbi:MAG TPA: hypothetical protein DIT99_21010 [Candidatus Latescibacteria bacterium]|nr:hypothetical protein [Candidatus Latescibacterota bacterium]
MTKYPVIIGPMLIVNMLGCSEEIKAPTIQEAKVPFVPLPVSRISQDIVDGLALTIDRSSVWVDQERAVAMD